jgi:putative membrane protein
MGVSAGTEREGSAQEQAGGAGPAAPSSGRAIAGLWPLAAGILILAVLWLGPLPAMSRRAFSPHMILHLGIMGVVAPLLGLGLLRLGLRLVRTGDVAFWAMFASGLEMLVVWGWHAPVPHEAAARRDLVFVLQQASFVVAGTAVWLTTFSGASRAALAVGVLAMLITSIHMTMLGVLLSLAPDLLYAPDVCMGAFGFDRLDDQRLGGALMAIGGGLPYLAGGLVLASRLISDGAPPTGGRSALLG